MAANASASGRQSVVALSMGIKERERRVDVFFYCLFMDEKLLRGKGLKPRREKGSKDVRRVNHLGQPIGVVPEWTERLQPPRTAMEGQFVASYRSTQTTTPQNSMLPRVKTGKDGIIALLPKADAPSTDLET